MHRRRTEAEVAGGGRRRVDEDPGIHAEAAAATGAACGRTQGRPERDAPGRTTTAPQRPGAGPAVAAAPQWAAALWSRRRRWAWGGLGAALGVLACVLLVQPTEAGKCVKPPKGSTAFCEIGHQVYVSSDTMQNDTEYWFNLDKKAETLTEEWSENMGCSKSVLSGESWCKNYACGLNFPKCTSFKDAPLPLCRQTCVDCFRTCTPDRPILPPGMYYPPGFSGNEDRSWGKQYKKIQYDAWTKAYICEADHKLVDGGRFLFFTIGAPCTGQGVKMHNSHWAMSFAFCAVALLAYQRP